MSKQKQTTASEGQLAALHMSIGKYFEWLLKDALDNEMPLAPTDVSNILKFLKDNNITAMPDDETMETLNKQFNDTMSTGREEVRQGIITQLRIVRDESGTDELAGVI